MRLSLNEIETTLRKGALGAGWPMGLAEEAGAAAAWLAAQGLDGVGTVLEAIAAGPAKASVRRVPAGWEFADARAAAAGPSAFDLIAAGDGEAVLGAVDQPVVLIGLAAVAAASFGGGFRLDWSGAGKGKGGHAEVGARALLVTRPLPRPGATVRIARLDSAPPDRLPPLPEGVEIGDALWSLAKELAALSYVPATAASRAHGAGAGLLDND